MTGFYYVYMLSDVATRTHHYVGMTEDIENRLAKHNAGQVPHTSKFAPWTIDAAIAVRDKTTAAQLERYLKSGSGRAFANKHLFATSCRGNVGMWQLSRNLSDKIETYILDDLQAQSERRLCK